MENEPNVTEYMKSQRLRWFVYVRRMYRDRTTKMAMSRKLIGRRKKGRPRKSCFTKKSLKVTD